MFSASPWKAGSLPPLRLPLAYIAFSTICFALALVGAILYAQDLTGFYYHPHILGLTHLVTLGWISGNILGLLYVLAPMALQIYLPAKRMDWATFALYAIGVSGMVTHFWQDLTVGMVWSAGCVYVAVLFVSLKILTAIRSSKAPRFVKAHVFVALLNFLLAGLWGFLIGLHKIKGFLPTSTSPNVIAHAHLAAVGWATMMVFGIAYRLLPMFLPGKPARGWLPWISGILMETGILTFFITTLVDSNVRWIAAILIVAGILIFMLNAIRIALHRLPAPPPEIPRPDFSMLHAPFAFICLLGSCAAGFLLLFLPPTEKTLQWALAYGCLGLVGFLGQLIIGFKPKILSVFVWYHLFGRDPSIPLQRPVDMPVRPLQATIFFLWVCGLPTLVAGIATASNRRIIAGATLLLASLILSTLHEFIILKPLFRKSG